MPSILDVEQSDSTDSEDPVTVRKRTEDNGEETDDIGIIFYIENT